MEIYLLFLKGLPTKSDMQRNGFKLIDLFHPICVKNYGSLWRYFKINYFLKKQCLCPKLFSSRCENNENKNIKYFDRMLIFANWEQYWKKSWMNYSECNQSYAFLFSHKDRKYKIAFLFSLSTNKRDCRFRGSCSRRIRTKRRANSCWMAGATFVRTTLDRKVHESTLLRRVH